MRAVLPLALVLCSLALLHRCAPTLFPGGGAGAQGADRALEIVVGARGALLSPARIGSGPERIGAAIRLGERTLLGTGDEGLVAAFVAPDFTLRTEHTFDVRTGAGAHALRVALEDAVPGELLVLASSGALEAAGAERARAQEELQRSLALLAARARPGARVQESWALIAVRLARGWVPLAEGYAEDAGVALAFVVAPELERYADFRGDYLLLAPGGEREVPLQEELGRASLRTGEIELARDAGMAGRTLSGLRARPTGTSARVAWSGIAFDQGSGLVAGVALADDAPAQAGPVRFEVRVEGELVLAREVRPGEPLQVLQADLRAFAGRRGTLELAVEWPQGAAGAAEALWAWPVLVHGYERAPLEAWTELR